MTDDKRKKAAVVSLGCDKNRVDTEKMLAIIRDKYVLTDDPTDAEIIIINTCAFIEAARKESIDTALEFSALRQNKLEKLVLTGCLAKKYADELFAELTEADIFLGTDDYELLPSALEESYRTGKRLNFAGKAKSTADLKKRVVTTPLHYAYMKIAEGCNNRCSYCLIPSIRGLYRSRKIEDIEEEAKSLGELSELILVAQDITRYGCDIYGKPCPTALIRRLSAIDNIDKIRLLYCYPDMITDELIAELKTNDKLIKYIDIPLQHSDETILRAMNRRGNGESYLKLIDKLKSEVPGIAIRSTFIAGFPGEDERAFENLKDFLLRAKLFNAGFFPYSREEGTPSYGFKDQVPERVKKKRVKELYELQKKISAENLKKFKGQIVDVVFDEIDYDKELFAGRAYFNAPDIDGKVYFQSDENVVQGRTYKVAVEKTDAYDLYGRTV